MDISRRQFLRQIGYAGAALSLGLYSSCTSPQRTPAKAITNADIQHPILKTFWEINPQLTNELLLLPEIRDGISQQDNQGLENLISLHEYDKINFKNAIDSALQIGLPKYRHYCSPLQALFWLCSDEKQLDTAFFFEKYTLPNLLRRSWGDPVQTKDERWADFQTVVDRLNGPLLVFYYGQFIKRSRKYAKQIPTPEDTFNQKEGIGWHDAAFLVHCLENAGYQKDGYKTYCMWLSGLGIYAAIYQNLQNEWFYVGGEYKYNSQQLKQDHFKNKISERGVGPYNSLSELSSVLIPLSRKEWAGGAANYKIFTSDELRRDFYKAKR